MASGGWKPRRDAFSGFRRSRWSTTKTPSKPSASARRVSPAAALDHLYCETPERRDPANDVAAPPAYVAADDAFRRQILAAGLPVAQYDGDVKAATALAIRDDAALRAAAIEGSLTLRRMLAVVAKRLHLSAGGYARLKKTYSQCMKIEKRKAVRELYQEPESLRESIRRLL